MTDHGGDVYIVNYDPSKLQLLSCAAQAGAGGIQAGPIPGTALSVVSNASGKLVILYNKQTGIDWTGVITVLRFKALQNGTAAISADRV